MDHHGAAAYSYAAASVSLWEIRRLRNRYARWLTRAAAAAAPAQPSPRE